MSRHFYVAILNLLNGHTEETSKAARIEEKHQLSNLEAVFNKTGTSANLQCEAKRKQYTDNNYELCMYNVNYEDVSFTKSWTFGNHSGNATFMWLVDWYVPTIVNKLLETNTIVTTNAGLNKDWEYQSKWDMRQEPMDVLSREFPLIWQANFAKNSTLMYRLSTETCTPSGLKKHNTWIREYSTRKPRDNAHILEFDLFTQERLHYIDCNHHPGPPAELEVQTMLNTLCPGLGTIVDRDALLRLFENTVVTRPAGKSILLYANKTLHQIPDLDTFHAGYFTLPVHVLSSFDTIPRGVAIAPIDCPRWTGSKCVSADK